MKNWKKISLMIIVIGGTLILMLLIILWRQEWQRSQQIKEIQVVTTELNNDKARADELLSEEEALEEMTESLVIPQVKLNIRL